MGGSVSFKETVLGRFIVESGRLESGVGSSHAGVLGDLQDRSQGLRENLVSNIACTVWQAPFYIYYRTPLIFVNASHPQNNAIE